MSLKSQIQTEHDSRISTPFDREPYCRGQRKGSNSLAMFLAVIAIGVFAYYSQLFIEKEYGYKESVILTTPEKVIVNERQSCLMINENPDCCSRNFTKKLKGIWGCL